MAEIRAEQGEMATHSYSVVHPHGPQVMATMRDSEEVPQTAPADLGDTSVADAYAYAHSMMGMQDEMTAGLEHEDPAFVLGMIPHHQCAIDMARIQLAAGSDPENMELARHIIAEQQKEIDAMLSWLEDRGIEVPDS